MRKITLTVVIIVCISSLHALETKQFMPLAKEAGLISILGEMGISIPSEFNPKVWLTESEHRVFIRSGKFVKHKGKRTGFQLFIETDMRGNPHSVQFFCRFPDGGVIIETTLTWFKNPSPDRKTTEPRLRMIGVKFFKAVYAVYGKQEKGV